MDKKKQGKRNRINGANFEKRVRKDLIGKGWIVSKWQSNVDIVIHTDEDKDDYIDGRLIPAKRKYNPFMRALSIGTGFPDFIAYMWTEGKDCDYELPNGEHFRTKIEYQVIGVECKINGKLDKKEKEKCKWLLENNIFSKIIIASKVKEKNRIKIIYEDFCKK